MPLVCKARLPKRFKINPEVLARDLQDALDMTINVANYQLFAKTYATFRDKPSWEVNKPGGPFMRRLSTTDRNYNRLNQGTSAHLISPKPGGILRFPAAFGPKTIPGQLTSLSGFESEEKVVTRYPVLHPGTKPRNFDKAVAKKIKAEFRKRVLLAIKRNFAK